jgi:hypothetical protein
MFYKETNAHLIGIELTSVLTAFSKKFYSLEVGITDIVEPGSFACNKVSWLQAWPGSAFILHAWLE